MVVFPVLHLTNVVCILGGEDKTARAWLIQVDKSLGMLKYSPSTASDNSLSASNVAPDTELRIGINAIDSYSPISPISIVVSANEDGCVRAWNVSTRDFLTPLRWARKVSKLRLRCLKIYIPVNYSEDVSPEIIEQKFNNEKMKFTTAHPVVICGGRDKIIHFIDVMSGVVLDRQLFGHEGIITCIAVTEKLDSALIVSGSEEYEIKVWCMEFGTCLFDLKGHFFDVNAVAIFTPSQNVEDSVIISGSVDCTLRLWKYGSTKHTALLCDVEAPVNAVVVADFDNTGVGNLVGPLVVAGSADASIKVWSLTEPYHLVHTFTGHHDEVTCLSVYRGEGCYNSLVSGSLDKFVKVWDLNDLEFVKNIEGHVQEISSVTLFSTDFTDPSIASSSTDVRISFDFKNESTNSDFVDECFQFDMTGLNGNNHSHHKWPRISQLVEKNGANHFLSRYCELFQLAIMASRPDFLATFLPSCPSVVVKCVIQYNCLQLALTLDQQDSVREIISCLIEYMQQGRCLEISSSYLPLTIKDLTVLALRCPEEFERLFVNMSLISHFDNLNEGEDFLRLSAASNGYEMCSCQEETTTSDDENSSSINLLTFSYLPVPISDHMKLLQAMCDVCDSTNRTDIFNSQAGILILSYAWAKFGRERHIKLMATSYIYILLATFNVYCFETLLKESYLVTRLFLIAQICFELGFSVPAAVGLYRDFFGYISSIWNELRLTYIIGGLIGNILRFYYMKELRSTRIILSVTSIAFWFDSLYYLRAFEATGPLGNERITCVV